MSQSLSKILSLFLSFCLILEQSAFAQTIDLSHYFARNSGQTIPHADKFRPLHLRYISYDSQANDFKLLLDKGDFFNQKTEKPKNEKTPELEKTTQELMKYFFIGLALPNDKFWVNLRPDSPYDILDPDLEKTDIGRIFLEADLQLKKDTSAMTSPQTKEGREYWDKLYKKAQELFGSENITIPTITRPWIVPDEIILRESPEGAYIYKATLKVMLEEDYLKSSQLSAVSYQQYIFNDPRLKELNEYSTQLIKESIIPKLTRQINTSKRYAPLRQAYYSLILAQWFKQKYGPGSPASSLRPEENSYTKLMDSGNLANLTSSQPYDKQSYFQQYQKSFKDGEYNLHEPVYTPMGQSIRRYMSGGITMPINKVVLPIPANESFFQRLKQPLSTFLMAITVTGSLLVSSAGAEGPAVKIVNPSENYFVNKQAEPNLEDLSQSKILPIKLYANQAVALANRKDLEKTLIFGLNKALYSRIDKAEMLAKLMGLLNNDIERLRIIKQVHSNRHSNDINPEIMRHWKQVLDNLKKKLPDDRGINLINLGEVGNEVMRDDIEKEMDWFKDVESVYEMDRLFESNNAVEKLFDLGEKIFPDLKRKARSGSEIAVETLKRHGAKAVEYILNTTPKDRRDEGYYFGIQLLKKIGEAGIGALETAMNAGIKNERGSIDVERQTLAAVALAGIGKPETIDEILKVWHTVDSVSYTERLQVALIKALGNIPAPKEKNKEIISELVNVYVGYGWDELAVATTTSLAQLYMREDSLELKMQIVDRLIGKLRSSFSRKHSLWKSITDARIDYDSLLWKLRDFNYISSADGISPEFKGLGDAFIEKYSKIYTEDNIRQINAALLQSATNDNIRVVLENLNIKNESIRRYIVGLALRYNEINIFDRSVFDLIKILSVYKNDDFATKTGNMDIVTQFSIARTVVETLSQLSAPINDVSINKALSFIIQTREQHAGRIIVDKDTNFIYLGHVGLSSENMPGLFKQKFNMNLRSFNIDNRYSQYSDPEGFVPTMDHFMDAVVYGPRKTTIYFSGHGLPDKLLLSNTIDPEGGSPWEHVIQYENFAGMLLRRAKNQGGSLSDLTIILDSCYSADFANKVLNNLSEDLQNGKIKTLPVIVTTSANGAASKVYVASDAIKSVFLRAEETEAFTINEIFKAMTEAGTRGEEFSLFLPMSSEEFMLFKQSLGVETNKKPDEKSDKRLNIVLPIIQARVYLKNYPPTHQHNKEESFVSSAIIDNNKGGIDLSRINKSIRTESVSSPGVGGLNNLVDADFDLNEELTQLRKLLNAEIVPSADRLNRYARAACSSSLSSPDTKDSALSLIAETFRLQENKAAPAAAELKALAAWLEQGW